MFLTDKQNVVRLKWTMLGVSCLESYGGEIVFFKYNNLMEKYIPVYGFGGWNDIHAKSN